MSYVEAFLYLIGRGFNRKELDKMTIPGVKQKADNWLSDHPNKRKHPR